MVCTWRQRFAPICCLSIFAKWSGSDPPEHEVEFGVGVLQAFWGYGIGKNLLQESIAWAERTGVKKMTLHVLETNEKAIRLYERLGFEVEGVLKKDRRLSDGNYYNTIVMGRYHD
nr:GNAT family N-acetyltransferase [Brevibacillus gelatini]